MDYTVIITQSAAGLPSFLLFMASAIVLVGLFIVIYIRITPHAEMALIRQGNAAAAVSFGGAVLGFALPLAQAISQSANLLDLAVWAVIALVVQLIVFWITSMLLGGAAKKIEAGDLAAALFLGLMAVSGGMLNAASMTYTG
jgi:putative membrane protein